MASSTPSNIVSSLMSVDTNTWVSDLLRDTHILRKYETLLSNNPQTLYVALQKATKSDADRLHQILREALWKSQSHYYLLSPKLFQPFASLKAWSPTLEQFQAEAFSVSDQVLTRWKQLQSSMNQNGPLIKRRWSKKSRTQQASILYAAWLEVPSKHLPDYQLARLGPKLWPLTKNAENIFLMPEFNIANLQDEDVLLDLLESRAKHHPRRFSRKDLRTSHIRVDLGVLIPAQLDDTMMRLKGGNSVEYGEVLKTTEENQGKGRLLAGLAFSSGEGLLVFRIQSNKYEMMNKIVQCIMHDKTALPASQAVPELATETALAAESASSSQPALEYGPDRSTRLNTDHNLPDSIDFELLLILCRGKLATVEDHLHDLRER